MTGIEIDNRWTISEETSKFCWNAEEIESILTNKDDIDHKYEDIDYLWIAVDIGVGINQTGIIGGMKTLPCEKYTNGRFLITYIDRVKAINDMKDHQCICQCIETTHRLFRCDLFDHWIAVFVSGQSIKGYIQRMIDLSRDQMVFLKNVYVYEFFMDRLYLDGDIGAIDFLTTLMQSNFIKIHKECITGKGRDYIYDILGIFNEQLSNFCRIEPLKGGKGVQFLGNPNKPNSKSDVSRCSDDLVFSLLVLKKIFQFEKSYTEISKIYAHSVK